ncbi:pyridoxamine 5'-phosphate oxidase family protein [Candidatus Saccharibacteria bacterium]|nr:pyridoxamine 5'-phosphate oxidase family protein [Candidatus Saccharibacteria bacterium]
MEDILDILSGVYYLATVEGDQPHVRAFDGACMKNGEIYIGTNSTKKVYQQILTNPKIEIYSMDKGILRFKAKALPVEDAELARELYEMMGKDSSKEDLAVLRLTEITGTLTNQMGQTREF